MKVTLQVNGREMTFSEQELIAIVEEHFSSEATEKVTTAEVAKTPTEGKWFEVKPQAIDRKLFEEEKQDIWQEKTRQYILEAFEKLKSNPKRYGKNFKTMMPKKDWSSKTVSEFKAIACQLGDHNADWVEQALEWAQRIANGESWETVCNDADTAKWYRLVVWKNGYSRLVGCCNPASIVDDRYYSDYDIIFNTVPLVVLYEK